MYVLQPHPDDTVITDTGSTATPVATLKCESGGVAHIIEDDHCYVLLLWRCGAFTPTPWWFPEAVDAMKTLPTPPRG